MAEPAGNLYFESSENSLEHSHDLYNFLVSEITASQHGSRFDIRPFTMEPTAGYPSPLNIDRPYCETIPTTDEHRLYIAKTAAGLVMPRHDYITLVEAMVSTYELPEVRKHMEAGGSVEWADSHFTYVGQVIQQIASWQALHDMGVPNPAERQVTVVSRLVGLFKLGIIPPVFDDPKDKGDMGTIPHHGGPILEDVLLRFGAALQTIPNSATGKHLTELLARGHAIRKEANIKAKTANTALVESGEKIFFKGPSGTENKTNEAGTYRKIGVAKDGTIKLTTDHNPKDGEARILTIPIFMENNPFTGDPEAPILPHSTPFTILAPRVVHDEAAYHDMMRELARVGNHFGNSSLPYRYERKGHFGRKSSLPEVVYVHKPV